MGCGDGQAAIAAAVAAVAVAAAAIAALVVVAAAAKAAVVVAPAAIAASVAAAAAPAAAVAAAGVAQHCAGPPRPSPTPHSCPLSVLEGAGGYAALQGASGFEA